MEPRSTHISRSELGRPIECADGVIEAAGDIDVIRVMRNKASEKCQLRVVRVIPECQGEKTQVLAQARSHFALLQGKAPLRICRVGAAIGLELLGVVERSKNRGLLRKRACLNGGNVGAEVRIRKTQDKKKEGDAISAHRGLKEQKVAPVYMTS